MSAADTSAISRPGLAAWLLLAPLLVWLIAFVVAPAAILVVYSFAERDELGRVVFTFTFENYRRIADPTYVEQAIRNLLSNEL